MKDMDRFVNFSDAVIAIAVTILVLPLVDRASDVHINSYHDFHTNLSQPLLVFLLSFIVICRYWQVHHNILNGIRTFTPGLFWLNAAWLTSIVLIPLTSEIISKASDMNVFVSTLYIGSLALVSYISVAMQLLIAHNPTLYRLKASPATKSTGFAVAISMSLALLLGLIPGVGPWALLVLIPAAYAGKALQILRSRAEGQDA